MIEKIKNLFFGRDNDSDMETVSNQLIVEKIEKVFTEILKRDTTRNLRACFVASTCFGKAHHQ